MLLLTDFGSCCDPNILGTPGPAFGKLVKTRSFDLFRPGLYAITHWFWIVPRSKCFANPELRLRGTRKNSQFWPILATFLCYSDPQFCMLLVTDFGSYCDPDASGTPMSGYRELVKTRSFGLLWPILYPISHSFWVVPRSKCFGNCAFGFGELVKTRSFDLFGQVCMLLLTNFGACYDPNVLRTPGLF